jgi:hypothetical protein
MTFYRLAVVRISRPISLFCAVKVLNAMECKVIRHPLQGSSSFPRKTFFFSLGAFPTMCCFFLFSSPARGGLVRATTTKRAPKSG